MASRITLLHDICGDYTDAPGVTASDSCSVEQLLRRHLSISPPLTTSLPTREPFRSITPDCVTASWSQPLQTE